MSSPRLCPQCGAEYALDQRFCLSAGTTLRVQNAAGDLVGSIVADRYHVIRKLGVGGMGQVYLAEHVKRGRKSALKVMNPALVKDADAISRFNREAANASRISQPNVADVAVAHEMGIVHRDLQPDNIMLARSRDGSDWVEVVDFGIAKAADSAAQKVTKTGLVVGTPEYMSPEQLAGDKLDGRSDIYALALVASNMLTGRLPFPAETVQESMIMRRTEQPQTLSEMRPEVAWPADVQTALDRALEGDANGRYATANEFGRALSESLERMEPMGGRPAPRMSEAAVGSWAPAAAAATTPLPPARIRVQGAAPVVDAPPAAAPASVQRRRPLTITLGAGVLATAMVIGRNGIRDDQALSVTPAGQAPSDGSPRRDTPKFAKQIDSLPSAGTVGRPPRLSECESATAVSSRLDSLENVASGDITSETATNVLRALEQMRGRITGNDQIVHAAIVRAFAEGSRKNNAAACAALRAVRPMAPGTRWAKDVERGISGCD